LQWRNWAISSGQGPRDAGIPALIIEVGRLRTGLRTLAGVRATKQGFALVPHRAGEVVVLARPIEEKHDRTKGRFNLFVVIKFLRPSHLFLP
jgi:hypothetical protein